MIDPRILPTSDFSMDTLPARLLDEARDVQALQLTPHTTVGYTVLNQHLRGNVPAVLSIGGFMSDIWPDRAYEGVQLAHTLQAPVFLLDMPGHGLSTPHNKKQIIDLCLRRNITSQAEVLTEAMLELCHDEDRHLFGISHGGYLALAMAAIEPHDVTQSIFGLDIPGVVKRSSLGLNLSYMVRDGYVNRRHVLQSLEGSIQQEDFETFKHLYGVENVSSSKFLKNNPGLFMLNLVSSVNASDGALTMWQRVLDRKSAKVTVVTSQNSGVSNSEAITDFIANLPKDQQDRSHQLVVTGEDHNIGIIHLMPRTVKWARQAYNGLKPTLSTR